MKLIDDVGTMFHHLWSVQASLFFFVLNGAVAGLAAFTDKIDPWLFLYLNIGGYALIGLLRLVKQTPPVTGAPSTDSNDPDSDKEILDALRQLIKQQQATGAKT